MMSGAVSRAVGGQEGDLQPTGHVMAVLEAVSAPPSRSRNGNDFEEDQQLS